MKALVIALALFASTASWAQKACRVKMKYNFEGNRTMKLALEAFTRNYINQTDIELVTKDEDYAAAISSIVYEDDHGYGSSPEVSFEAYPSNRIEYLSDFSGSYSKDYMPSERITVKVFKRYLLKLFPKFLSSCEQLKRASRFDGSDTLKAEVGDTFKTSKGAVFTKVFYPASGPLSGAFGNAWKDPSGKIWSQTLNKLYQNIELPGTRINNGVIEKSDATEACRRIGGSLPAPADYQKLVSYFDYNTREESLTDKGSYQLNQLFPWSRGAFWTSHVKRNGWGFQFFHPRGFITSIGQRQHEVGVRCIVKPQ